MQVPIEGGAARKVSDIPAAGFFDVSPDGRTLAFATIDHAAGHAEKIALVSADTGAAIKLMDFQRPRVTNLIRFARDGKSLVYTIRENGADNLWQQPLDGSPGKQLTSFKAEHIWDFHWSPDGSKLAMVRGHTDSDVVLIRSQQQ
jgi:Tol biopolymer transport system component